MRAGFDERVVTGARRAIERHGWRGTTMQRIAAEAGVSRMTLHRNGVTKERLLAALAERLVEEQRKALWPAITGSGTARMRLELALHVLCEQAESNLALFDALDVAASDAIYQEAGEDVLTRTVFTDPIRRLLLDGIADGSLRVDDPDEAATVVFNAVGWTYHHLRAGHGWPAPRAARSLVRLVVDGLRP